MDPNDPSLVAPLVAYLVEADCPLTGQVLSVRGGSIAVNHGWSQGARVDKEGTLWTVTELPESLGALPLEDPFDRLANAVAGALGAEGRVRFEEMVHAQLDKV